MEASQIEVHWQTTSINVSYIYRVRPSLASCLATGLRALIFSLIQAICIVQDGLHNVPVYSLVISLCFVGMDSSSLLLPRLLLIDSSSLSPTLTLLSDEKFLPKGPRKLFYPPGGHIEDATSTMPMADASSPTRSQITITSLWSHV